MGSLWQKPHILDLPVFCCCALPFLWTGVPTGFSPVPDFNNASNEREIWRPYKLLQLVEALGVARAIAATDSDLLIASLGDACVCVCVCVCVYVYASVACACAFLCVCECVCKCSVCVSWRWGGKRRFLQNCVCMCVLCEHIWGRKVMIITHKYVHIYSSNQHPLTHFHANKITHTRTHTHTHTHTRTHAQTLILTEGLKGPSGEEAKAKREEWPANIQ